MNAGTAQDGLLSVARAAAWAGVSMRTVRRWLRAGLPFAQPIPGGRVLIRQNDLERFLRSQQHAGALFDQCVREVLEDLQQKTDSQAATHEPVHQRKESGCGRNTTWQVDFGQGRLRPS
jgi:excisionase family DNA binding protein